MHPSSHIKASFTARHCTLCRISQCISSDLHCWPWSSVSSYVWLTRQVLSLSCSFKDVLLTCSRNHTQNPRKALLGGLVLIFSCSFRAENSPNGSVRLYFKTSCRYNYLHPYYTMVSCLIFNTSGMDWTGSCMEEQ